MRASTRASRPQVGDEEGAAEMRRAANGCRLNQRINSGKQQQQRTQKGSTGKKSGGSGASTARAGGRRV